MSSWLYSGWLFLLIPLALVVTCALMCVVTCGFRRGGCARCWDDAQRNQPHQ
jgi:hypothetical protein